MTEPEGWPTAPRSCCDSCGAPSTQLSPTQFDHGACVACPACASKGTPARDDRASACRGCGSRRREYVLNEKQRERRCLRCGRLT